MLELADDAASDLQWFLFAELQLFKERKLLGLAQTQHLTAELSCELLKHEAIHHEYRII